MKSLCILWTVLFFFLTSISHADLGLDSSDFTGERANGRPVTGIRVDGVPIAQSGDSNQSGDNNNGSEDGSSTGTPGPNEIDCQQLGGISFMEGSLCFDCFKGKIILVTNGEQHVDVASQVNLFSRSYLDEKVDLSIKAPGGHLKVYRLYSSGKWQFEHEYNHLNLGKSGAGNLVKTNLTYRKGEDGQFHYKTFTIKEEGDIYRWQNKAGKYVLYNNDGQMVEAGDRHGILARYTYKDNRLVSIGNRDNKTAFYFHYGKDGKLTSSPT